MFTRWLGMMGAAILVVGAGLGVRPCGARAAETPADIEAPDDLQVLHLTDLQRRVLEQAFHRHTFQAPRAPAACADGSGPPDAALAASVEPVATGGLCRLGTAGDMPPQFTVTVALRGAPASIDLRYYVEDFYGRKVADGVLPAVFPDAAGHATADLALKELNAFGYYHVLVTATCGDRTATAACGLALVHPAEEGPDPKGPFGLAAPLGEIPADLPEVCRRLGVSHLAVDWPDGRAVALHVTPGAAPESRWDEGHAILKRVLEAGLVPTGVISVDQPVEFAEPPALVDVKAGMVAHFAAKEGLPDAAQPMLQWQLGRRPVLGDDSWAQAAAAYRETVSSLLAAVRKTGAPVSVSVAVTPQMLVDVLLEGPALAGADGVALCLDAGSAAPNLRSGAYRRSLDYAVAIARRAGLKRMCVGETGDDPAAASPQQQAWKLVTRHVLALAGGAERIYLDYGRGAPEPLPSAAAYAWMTHLLTGTAYQEDLWPDTPLVQAHLLAGPERRVAVVWSWAGEDPAKPDTGALVLDDGSRLEAYDVVGNRVGIWKGERLIVPLGEAPVYLVSSDLKANEVRDRVRKARILGVSPASVWIRNLVPGNSPGRMNVTLWVQSQRPYRLEAMAGLLLPEGWKARQTKQQFGLDGGQAREIVFECDVPADLGPPPYPIQTAVSLGEEWARRTQAVWPTVMPERTIEVGYGTTGWEGIRSVALQSKAGDVKAEVRTAWDAQNFYFAAAVARPRGTFKAGRFAFDGDAIQLAWGAGDRADDDFGRPARDRALPVGAFRDTDHLMAVTFGPSGAQVVRLRGPRIALRAHVPGNLDAWYGPVEGAVADISRDADNNLTLYSAAIPWKALAPLKGERGRTVRFGFRLGNGDDPPLDWSAAAGVPDYLAGPGSFLPISDADTLPCQTLWTLVGPTKE
jgi:hypothetical protein